MKDGRVIVIGSGPCGAIAAQRLVRRGVAVTMIESGQRQPGGFLIRMAGNTILRRRPGGDLVGEGGFDATLDPDTQWYRDLSPGGLSNHWTGAVPRFAPEDFGHGVAVDAVHVWPVTYQDLEPFYDSVEQLIGVSGMGESVSNLPANRVSNEVRLPAGWDHVAETAVSYGHSMVPLPMANGQRWSVVRRGTEFNSWTEIVEDLRGSGLFEIVTGAHVTQLNWSSAKAAVDSLDFRDPESGNSVRVPVRAVVVAAGALNSTKLLLSSVSPDFPAGLGDVHRVLGRYLHDHPSDWWTFSTTQSLKMPVQPIYMTRESVRRSDPLLAAGWTIGLAQRLDRLKTYWGSRGNQFSVKLFGSMIAEPDRFVQLEPTQTDEFGGPRMRIHFGYDAATRQNMADARIRIRDVLTDAGIGYRPHGAPNPKLIPGSSVHYAGSIRMHDDPRFGMLDGWNRLHAVPNVLVVDASCFTTGPEKNPTLTAMALADRAADRLADDLD